MAGTRHGYGVARSLLIALAVLLVAGAAGSLFMGSRERNDARSAIAEQAATITDSSLTLVFRPEDTMAQASEIRASDLTDRIGPVVLEPSDFDMVTLFDPNGTVLYSVDESRIGNELAGESERIRTALKDGPQVRTSDGTVSVMVPLEFRSGVGRDAAVELTRSDDPTSSAGSAWRVMALILAIGAVIVGFVLWRTARLANSVGAQASFAQRSLQAAALASGSQPRPEVQAPRPITVPTPGLREEGDARRKAEERAFAAEERLSVLQEQYRKTLEDLQVAQRRATETRPDPETQDRLLRAEDRARLLEEEARKAGERLAAVAAERDQLSKVAAELRETSTERDALARERDAAAAERDGLREELDALAADRAQLAAEHAKTAAALAAKPDAPQVDAKLIDRLARTETEAIGLRAELEGAQTQLDVLRKDLETARADLSGTTTQADRAEALQRDLDGAHAEMLRSREASEAVKTELEEARAELLALRTEEQRAAMLEDELRAARAELVSANASHQAELLEREANLESAQTQLEDLRRDLETARADLSGTATQAERAEGLQRDLDGAHVEVLRAREASESVKTELAGARTELEDARAELRALRTEEQRAAMLEDELRAARAELASANASHRAELIEREADLEEKVRTIREEFQDQLEASEARHRDELSAQAHETDQRVASVESSAAAELEALRRDLADRTDRFAGAEQEIATASAAAQQLGDELTEARRALDEARTAVEGHESEIARLAEASTTAERQAAEAAARATKLAADLEDATQGNADLNRRLQELEARRALETAAAEGRADLDDLLRITQERLAGQTEKLITAEERVHELERDLSAKLERIDEVEGELRQQQMAEAMRQIRGEHETSAPADDAIAVGETVPFDDRRATSPFVKELSLDAKKSLSRILGLTQILKHKKDAKDQAQLIRQLTTYARRLDHVVSDMTDAEELVRGTVHLSPKRTDLEALVQRVVEESGLEETHEVRVDTERIVVAVDQLRTEQILAGLLRGAGDRTPGKKVVRVRLRSMDGGALLSVEDPETSSDASLSPVVRRFAEVQGGWAKVESVEEGGSAFRVFLPDGSGDGRTTDEDGTTTGDAATNPDLHIVVEGEPDTWDKTAEQIMVQELHRLSELAADD